MLAALAYRVPTAVATAMVLCIVLCLVHNCTTVLCSLNQKRVYAHILHLAQHKGVIHHIWFSNHDCRKQLRTSCQFLLYNIPNQRLAPASCTLCKAISCTVRWYCMQHDQSSKFYAAMKARGPATGRSTILQAYAHTQQSQCAESGKPVFSYYCLAEGHGSDN